MVQKYTKYMIALVLLSLPSATYGKNAEIEARIKDLRDLKTQKELERDALRDEYIRRGVFMERYKHKFLSKTLDKYDHLVQQLVDALEAEEPINDQDFKDRFIKGVLDIISQECDTIKICMKMMLLEISLIDDLETQSDACDLALIGIEQQLLDLEQEASL